MTTSVLAAEGYPFVMLKADMCRLLHCHENTLYRRIQIGNLPAWQPRSGRRARYEWLRPNVEKWLLYSRRPGASLHPAGPRAKVQSVASTT